MRFFVLLVVMATAIAASLAAPRAKTCAQLRCTQKCEEGIKPRCTCTAGFRLGPNRRTCVRKTTYFPWAEWNACSKKCGEGKRRRRRTCIPGDGSIDKCSKATQEEFCIGDSCPTTTTEGPPMLKPGPWGQWGPCTESCGDGIMARYRECIGARPGRDCVENLEDTKKCSKPCPTEPPKPKCPADWTKHPAVVINPMEAKPIVKTCIKVFEDKKRNWHTARKFCQDQGADLVVIKTASELEVIKSVMGKSRYWIGLHDQHNKDGRHRWLDDKLPYKPLTFTAWRFKPQNHLGNEYCVELIGKHQGQWNDKPCNNRRHVICQK